jgi:hypothetical protein
MARPNEKAKRPARLVCVAGHEYVDDSVPQVGMYVEDQAEAIWRIEQGTGLRCRVCGEEIDYSRSKPL